MEGKQLKEIREAAGKTAKEVKNNMGCSYANVCQIEKASGLKLPTIESYLRACGYEVEISVKLRKDGKQQEIKL